MTVNLKKKWTIDDGLESYKVLQFARDLNVPYSLSKILIARGITNKAEAKDFFMPSLEKLYDPFLMKDMDKAVERLLKVIETREKILVFGDYDVDGTSGVSMFHVFLKNLGVPNRVFIPDRFTDGYGLSNSGIDLAAKENIKLIVAIDCGITACDKVEYAKSLGIEFIICDHHQPPENLPCAFSVLDPLQDDCKYPFKYLCGTGVAFKVIQAICMKLEIDDHLKLLDFVAVATAADMVPVLGENRILLHFGFKQIIENPRPSFETLIRNAGFRFDKINTSNVVFSLGPRINAVGRLGDATRAVEFLTCDNLSKADSLAGVLESENTNRKKIDSEIYLQAQDKYDDYHNNIDADCDDVAIVLHNPDWHPGVLGIIASRMVEKYYKPSIILTTFNGHAKGSARSVSNFNIYEALKQCSSEFSGLVQFGGHYHAAGVEIELGRIDEFRKCFNRIAKNIIDVSELGKDILIPEIKIDSDLDINNIDKRFVKILKHFEPFGPGNMTPVFLTRNVQVVGDPRVFNGSTYVFKVRRPVKADDSGSKGYSHNGYVMECVFFRPASVDEETCRILKTGSYIDFVYSVEENHWNDKTKIQLRIRDFKQSTI
jgi:single-stranded-DNA-specific exonuclease